MDELAHTDAALPKESAATAGPAEKRARRGWVSVLVWASIVPLAAWAALRLVPGDVHFQWIRAVAFTPYVALASVAVPLLALLSRRWAALVVSLVVAGTLAACVLPRAVPGGNPTAAGPPLRVLSANLLMGGVPPGTLIRLVRDLRADVLTLQELTPSAVAGLRDVGLGELLPYHVEVPGEGAHGSGIYSRFPLTPGQLIRFGVFRQATATVDVPGAPRVSIVSVHPCAPRYADRRRCWAEGLAALPLPDGPVRILAGDFNATLDHARMRRLLDAGYHDAAATTGEGLATTWPYRPWHFNGWSIPPVTLDHILVDPRVAVGSFAVHRLALTDHLAVFAELTLPAR
ncbi:endonuclease/exonuclease/phosphatase family protein [Microtetraspora sp. NBRC 16547]|uniref:endonuclease/exonuclease/phosphatase family protein n=1 Tax=Microtetraspora sp. NBRC 16547 TaxID=3030993 RepID=UPI0024A34402|nr:endonuclease/exonuclease/phosphatase family protein [Microtetraspora sp. NBRC 16547]GLW97036.1 endonuclease [Microtetraspora sp. NBRC 16547]